MFLRVVLIRRSLSTEQLASHNFPAWERIAKSGSLSLSLSRDRTGPGRGRQKGWIPLNTRTGFLISQIKQVQGRVFERLLQSCGVEEFNGPQGRILYVLWQRDSVPIVELSQKTGLAKNTLTAMLGRMEGSGLIARRASEADRRQSLIALTEKARGLRAKYDEVSQQMNELFFAGFAEAEIEDLEGYLDRIVTNLEKTEKNLKQGKEPNHGKGKN